MGNSTATRAKSKPAKPYPDFPLFSHNAGQWCKKIRGRLHYFGVWTDADAALKRFNREGPYLREGREPPAIDIDGGCEMRQLCNEFLRTKKAMLDAGDLAPRTYGSYFRTCETMVDHFGKHRLVDDLRPDDFRKLRAKLTARYDSPVSVMNAIKHIKIVLNFAFANDLIDKPVRYGSSFDKPSRRVLRKNRNEGGAKLFTREECLLILDYLSGKPVMVQGGQEEVVGKPKPHLRAMVLLGLNCGFGNTDLAYLPQKAVDLDTGWIEFPRPKTEINRRVPLWPETVKALEIAIKARPKPRDASGRGLCFLTYTGRPWLRVHVKENTDIIHVDSLSKEFKKILQTLNINGRRRLGLYGFRHCFETVAGECRDQVAVDAVMGHVDASMAANYRHGVSDERLRDAVNTVHDWLFAKPKPR